MPDIHFHTRYHDQPSFKGALKVAAIGAASATAAYFVAKMLEG
jgi:hypothetical protein